MDPLPEVAATTMPALPMGTVAINLGLLASLLALVAMVYWLFVLGRVVRLGLVAPHLSAGLSLTPRPDLLSIIVPAHNEARVIARLARSILDSNDVNFELIVVLDRCTDDTRARLEAAGGGDPRLLIIENSDCPSDWAGKCNAARVGAEAASSEWLLFTDADVQFDPNALQAALCLAVEGNLSLLSVYTTLTATHWWEKVVQPVAAISLARQFPADKVNHPTRPRSFANGQFMLFSRAMYDSIGGHQAVKDDLLEDIAFARFVHRDGGRIAVVASDGLIVTSMYPSLGRLMAGWKRIFIETTRRNPGKLRWYGVRSMASGLGAPIGFVAVGIGISGIIGGSVDVGAAMILCGLLGLFAQAFGLFAIFRLSQLPTLALFTWSAGCVFLALIFFGAARDLTQQRPVKWGGREYRFGPNSELLSESSDHA